MFRLINYSVTCYGILTSAIRFLPVASSSYKISMHGFPWQNVMQIVIMLLLTLVYHLCLCAEILHNCWYNTECVIMVYCRLMNTLIWKWRVKTGASCTSRLRRTLHWESWCQHTVKEQWVWFTPVSLRFHSGRGRLVSVRFGQKNCSFSSVWFSFLTSTKTSVDMQWCNDNTPARVALPNSVGGRATKHCWEGERERGVESRRD